MTPSNLALAILVCAAALAGVAFVLTVRRPLSLAAVTLLTVLWFVPTVAFGASYSASYGWTLFVLEPLLAGFVAGRLYSRNLPGRSRGDYFTASTLSTVAFGLGLFLSDVEGLLCLVMMAPLAFPLAWAGGLLAYAVQRRFWSRAEMPALLLLVLLGAPVLMGAEGPRRASRPSTRSVRRWRSKLRRTWSGGTWSPSVSCPLRKTGSSGPASPTPSGPGSTALEWERSAIASSRPAPSSSRSRSGTSPGCSVSTWLRTLLPCGSCPFTATSTRRTSRAFSFRGAASSC